MANTWQETLKKQLIETYGQKRGSELNKKYGHLFSTSYAYDYTPDRAVKDVNYLEQLSDDHPIELDFYQCPDDKSGYPLHLRFFQWEKPIPLSDILPMLENLDVRTGSERPHKIKLEKKMIWISDFAVTYGRAPFNVEQVKDLFEEAFVKIYFGQAENDGFNKLVLASSLSWREIVILRAYAKYLKQINFRFSQSYIEKALVDNAAITRNLVDLFFALHDPKEHSSEKAKKLQATIVEALERVVSLDEDRILRRLLELITITLRTNYFQPKSDSKDKKSPSDNYKSYVSFKLDSRKIPELPQPMPLYEIFVYATHFEGIHLRFTKVARGGIRWSDRREDFRTEVLGLMKAQVVKNAVIVPSGAKGGFVLKTTTATSREALQAEVVSCYKNFICGLLDITDNIIGKDTVHPSSVVCYDDFDPYLVVAADKGTATFSDIANDIAASFDFWLGDAFASGGRTGYDHKKMGITARGAWESIKRHFRELNIDPLNTDITLVGIGDMSGDVFGNGMIYSKHIKLLAAFDHRHIFLDPNPDAEMSYYERIRLFNLPTSSWEDYNPKIISKGGGVFKRSLKSIEISTQVKAALGIKEDELPPNELLRAILKAPVDLLYNGGIGTYVKASHESNANVGDRTNDYCRVDGIELRCRVVGEGGNLGFTQLGRVEYALQGGLINTDFIDNSGGVDCSDHEVNLKILLNPEVKKHKLTEAKRNKLLASLTDEVADLVLYDNYAQALVMSFSAYHAKQNIGLHTNYIKELESLGILKRKVEFLPDDKELIERKAAGKGLTRPELAILLAYTKIHIKHELLNSELPEDMYLSQQIESAFPPSIRKKYKNAMIEHKLHRDIIATQLSNHVVNQMGFTFVYRLQTETGATVDEIVRAHAVASEIFGTKHLQQLIESLDFKLPVSEQYDMLYNIRHLINLATRWFLHGNHLRGDLSDLIDHYSTRVQALEKITPTLMGGLTKKYLDSLVKRFVEAGIPPEIAQRIATYRAIYTSLNIIEVATRNNFDLIKTAKIYFAAGERVNLLWFRDQIANDSREGHWNALARLTLRDELDIAQRALTIAIMKHDQKEDNPKLLIDKWIKSNHRALDRWDRLLSMLHTSSVVDYTMFFIAMRELLGLIITSHDFHMERI